MREFRIQYVEYSSPTLSGSEHIAYVGGDVVVDGQNMIVNGRKRVWRRMVGTVIDAMAKPEREREIYYTQEEGPRAPVLVQWPAGRRPYLHTAPDTTPRNNLVNLPGFPPGIELC
jgi:hypothetical protein